MFTYEQGYDDGYEQGFEDAAAATTVDTNQPRGQGSMSTNTHPTSVRVRV